MSNVYMYICNMYKFPLNSYLYVHWILDFKSILLILYILVGYECLIIPYNINTFIIHVGPILCMF